MNELQTAGKWMVIAGGVLVLTGGFLWVLARAGFLGRLPGDVRIERPGLSCVIPLASSIVLSILLTIVLNVIVRLLNR
jgi:hypothetical protein